MILIILTHAIQKEYVIVQQYKGKHSMQLHIVLLILSDPAPLEISSVLSLSSVCFSQISTLDNGELFF